MGIIDAVQKMHAKDDSKLPERVTTERAIQACQQTLDRANKAHLCLKDALKVLKSAGTDELARCAAKLAPSWVL